jgi:hypothetical protein
MAKKRIMIPEVFNIANTTISSDAARKLLKQRVARMTKEIPVKVKKVQQKIDVNNTDKLAKFNFLCGG